MPDDGFLPRATSLPESRDFALLRQRGLEAIETLGRELWTDYNVHDPGITLLELFAYAITDLGTRALYPVRDLFTEEVAVEVEENGATFQRTELRNVGDFHLAQDILPCAPVSFRDLRKLLVDLDGVKNAWIERHHAVVYALDTTRGELTDAAAQDGIELSGLFDVFVQYEEDIGTGPVQFRRRLSEPTASFGSLPARRYIATHDLGVSFRANQRARLESVSVSVDAPGDVVVRLTDARGNELAKKSVHVAGAHALTPLALGFELVAGHSYRLDAHGTHVKLMRAAETRPLRLPDGPGAPVVELLPDTVGPALRYFFFDWALAYDSAGRTEEEVRAAVVDRIHRNRNLCEDVVNVAKLLPEEIGVCSEIELAPEADTESVAAEIFFELGRYVAPDIVFHSLDELLASGRAVEDIFEGPLLDHGFVDDAELDAIQRRCELRASDLIEIIMSVPGVVAVRTARLMSFIDGVAFRQDDWQLVLSEDPIRTPVFEPARSKLVFYKRGLPYYAASDATARLLAEKQRSATEAKLKVPRGGLPAPLGVPRHVAEYYPLQNELPATYCVGQIRVPKSESAERRAQAKQLKAYLLLFEQLFASFLAQLGHAKELFSWRRAPGAERTYFTQVVGDILDPEFVWLLDDSLYGSDARARRGDALDADIVAALRPLLEQAVEAGPEAAVERRARFLAHLAARYAECLDEYAGLMQAFARASAAAGLEHDARLTAGGPDGATLGTGDPRRPLDVRLGLLASERVIADGRSLLADYPAASARRGVAVDFRFPEAPGNFAGFKRRVYRLLGIHGDTDAAGGDELTERALAGRRFVIRQGPLANQWQFVLLDEAERNVLFESIGCGARATAVSLLDVALALGGDPDNWETRAGVELLVRRCSETDVREVGHLRPGVELAAVKAYFAATGAAEGFELVEHLLLRRRTLLDPFLPVQLDGGADCDCPPVRDPYSFRIAVILPAWSPRFRDVRFRRFVEDTIRREAPAHVFARICWINHDQMRALEDALLDFRFELARVGSEPARLGDGDGATRTGRLELPGPHEELPQDLPFSAALRKLVKLLYELVNVYPLAELHACEEASGETPQVTLNNTNLGTQ